MRGLCALCSHETRQPLQQRRPAGAVNDHRRKQPAIIKIRKSAAHLRTRQSHMRMKPGSVPPGCSSAALSCVPISHCSSKGQQHDHRQGPNSRGEQQGNKKTPTSRSMPIHMMGLFSSLWPRSATGLDTKGITHKTWQQLVVLAAPAGTVAPFRVAAASCWLGRCTHA